MLIKLTVMTIFAFQANANVAAFGKLTSYSLLNIWANFFKIFFPFS